MGWISLGPNGEGYWHNPDPSWRRSVPPDLRPRSTTAILAFVALLVFAPAGLVLGVLAARECLREDKRGIGLAAVSMFFGGLVTLFFVIGVLM